MIKLYYDIGLQGHYVQKDDEPYITLRDGSPSCVRSVLDKILEDVIFVHKPHEIVTELEAGKPITDASEIFTLENVEKWLDAGPIWEDEPVLLTYEQYSDILEVGGSCGGYATNKDGWPGWYESDNDAWFYILLEVLEAVKAGRAYTYWASFQDSIGNYDPQHLLTNESLFASQGVAVTVTPREPYPEPISRMSDLIRLKSNEA